MQLNDFKKINIGDEPGVYFFKKGKEILYIGKATSLKDRVRSYFSPDLIKTRGVLLVDMLSRATEITFQVTGSVLEALLLETELIKKHQPYYNTKEKDNKSYAHVVITNEQYPAVMTIRGRELEQALIENPNAYLYTFGPFTSGSQLREALKITRKIFPYRDEKCKPLSGRACFNASIGLCPGVCVGRMSEKEYKKQINRLALFLAGNVKQVLSGLEKEMKAHIKKLEFEQAEIIKRKIYALTHIQDIALIKRERSSAGAIRIEAYDIAHMAGKSMVGVMVVTENGEPAKDQYRKFIIKTVHGANDPAALQEIIERRFAHDEWPAPDVIVVDGNEIQQRAAEEAMRIMKVSTRIGKQPIVVSVVKDDKHKARAVLTENEKASAKLIEKGVTKEDVIAINAEAHRFAIGYFRKKQRKDVYL
jgi:excinuclease ABC subunit C